MSSGRTREDDNISDDEMGKELKNTKSGKSARGIEGKCFNRTKRAYGTFVECFRDFLNMGEVYERELGTCSRLNVWVGRGGNNAKDEK